MRKLFIVAGIAGVLAFVFRDRLRGLFGGTAEPSGGDWPSRWDNAPDSTVDDAADVTLAHRVETELFRSEEVPKGQINLNVEHGVVYLRGEVDSQELVDDLVARARDIEGVLGVQNLLHLPGVEAPMHQ